MSFVRIFTIILLGVTFTVNSNPTDEKPISKRGIPLYTDEFPAFPSGFATTTKFSSYPLGPWASTRSYPPSTSEVSNAIASAKQASANVLIAQQQFQAARDHVLNQQRISMDKETAAAILTQKSEAAAAVQRSEAAAAAQAVVLAQQRLATAKLQVAHQQRIAAAKEAEAAAALHNSAHAAAAEIHRSEHESAKIASLQRTGAAALAHHVASTKDAALFPLTSGNNHISNIALPWHGTVGSIPPSGTWPATGSGANPQYTPKSAYNFNPWG